VSYDAYLCASEQVSKAVNRAVDDPIVNCVMALLEDPRADSGDVAYSCHNRNPGTIAALARRAA